MDMDTENKELQPSSEEQPAPPAQVKLGDIVEESMRREKKTLTKKQLWTRIGLISLAALAAIAIVVVSVVYAFLGRVNRESEMSGDLHINTNMDFPDDVQNIALIGQDTRVDNEGGLADVIIILSLDYKRNTIKMTSIARDSYVDINGRYDKITHAYAYGKAKQVVKTLNKNYNMNITDYAYINFFEFVELVDLVGGVDIDVSESEKNVMNTHYIWHLNSLGLKCEKITKTGMQHLTGAQALAYCRNRYTGNDVDRGNRHKEVLEAMFNSAKEMPLSKFPSFIGKVLEMCHTTMTDSELMTIATWAITKSPSMKMFGLPTPACNPRSGNDAKINGVWYYIYDLDIATRLLHEFVYEEDASTEPSETRTMPTKKTQATQITQATQATSATTTATQATSATTAAPTSATSTQAPTSSTQSTGDTDTATSSTEPVTDPTEGDAEEAPELPDDEFDPEESGNP